MSAHLYVHTMNVTCQDKSLRLNIYLNQKDEVVGIYYAHSPIRGTAFRTLFSKQYPTYPNHEKLVIVQELESFLNGKTHSFTAPYTFIGGSKFQLTVWKEISRIPIHHVVSYTHIASKISPPSSSLLARAVGSAVGTNPLSILIPCHRVLPQSLVNKWKSLDLSTCKIGNYNGGSDIKRALLMHEATI